MDGWSDGATSDLFCGLQLDLATIANMEFCTASISISLASADENEHISLATRWFAGTHREADIQRWTQKVLVFCTV